MAVERRLPEQRNPLVEDERAPAYEILVERRCLGQTELKVKPGQVGTSSATKPDNLGVLDYAHLRVPLPKDLSSSGIFARGPNKKYPEAYFLMRRSSDGYVSATGMFKAAFPYAQVEEEVAEKEYMKTLSGTSEEEIAGNVWIHPDQALALSDEYGLRTWIEALLDSEAITHGTSDPAKHISSPPPYRPKETNGGTKSPKSEKKSSGRRSTRERSLRSASPTKKPMTPARKIATPKTRRGRGRGTTASVEPEPVNGDATSTITERQETVKIEVETTTQPATIAEEEEETTTNVKIEVPSSHPDLKIPDDPKTLMAEARRMVAEAESLVTGSSSATKAKSKRKATEMLADDEGPLGLDSTLSAPKRMKMEIDTRRDRLRRRTAVGIGATLAIGGLVPVISSLIPIVMSAAFGS